MSDQDVTIDKWTCCTGGSLGVRRVARAPNSVYFELTESRQLQMHEPGGTRFERVPAAVLAWLVAPLAEPQGAPRDPCLRCNTYPCSCAADWAGNPDRALAPASNALS